MNMTEMEETDIEEMADNSKKREKFVDDVKKSLKKTLEVCLTPKEVAKIQREFEKNVEYQETLATNSPGGSYDVPTVISNIVTSQVERTPPQEPSSSKVGDNFVKPKFMRVNDENPFPFPAPEEKKPKHVSKELKVFEKTFTRTKQMEKVERNLRRQKKRAERSLDKNKKYPGFGEVYDPNSEKMKRKAEKKLEKELRRKNRAVLLKKANVSKEEKDLMNELILVAENSVSNSAMTSAAEDSGFNDSGVGSSQSWQQPPQDLKEVETNQFPQLLQHNNESFDVSDLLFNTSKSQSVEQDQVVEKNDYYHKMETINEFELQRDAISSQNFIDDLDTLLEM